MFYKLGKKLFKIFIESLNFVRVALVFLAFFTILYWFLQLGQATFIEPFAPFFESIKNITHMFYNRTVVIDKEAIDFSFLIASLVMIFLAWALKFAVEYVEFGEKKYDSIYKWIKQKAEAVFNLNLEKEYLREEQKNNKIVILLKFAVTNLEKDSFFHKDVSVGVEEIQKKALTEFLQHIETKLKFEKRVLDNGVFLYFNSFDNADNIIFNLQHSIDKLKQKYTAEKWQINYFVGIETYAHDNELNFKMKNLITLIKLNLINKIVCLATFKQRYSLIKTPRYIVEQEGLYSLNDTNEEVFYVKILR